MTEPAREAINAVRRALSGYVFQVDDEASVQRQVLQALGERGVEVLGSEVIARVPEKREPAPPRLRNMPAPKGGRYDILVCHAGVRLVLELKVSGSAPAVERQAQRYALTHGIDAVALVTTSNRLARGVAAIEDDEMLGGKPFGVVLLRCF
jgi:hypothetical protein